MITLNKVFEDAFEQFDWARVQKTMKALKWCYAPAVKATPSIKELQDTVRMLFKDAVECAFQYHEESGTAGTGGFEVTVNRYIVNEEIKFSVRIKFVVEDSDSCSEDLKN